MLFIVTDVITAHCKGFSLTQTCRNLYIGRSSDVGILPQAETPWPPWKPRHSNGQCRVGVSRTAALSHRPPALIQRRAGITAIFVLSFSCPSRSELFLVVSGCHLVTVSVPPVLEKCQSQWTLLVWKPHTSEQMSEPSLASSAKSQHFCVCVCVYEWVHNNQCCISLFVCVYKCL